MSTDGLSNHLSLEIEQRIARLVRKHAQHALNAGQAFPLSEGLMDRRLILFSNQILSAVFSEVLGQKNCVNPYELSRRFLGLLRTSVENGFIADSFLEKMMTIVFSTLDYLLEVEPERYEPILTPQQYLQKQLFE